MLPPAVRRWLRLPAVRGKSLDPRRISHSFTAQGGRPHADSPLIEFNLKKSTGSSRKSEHVARHEAKRLVYKIFKVLGQRVTSEVRSNVQNVKIPLPPIIWLLMALDKKLTSSVFLLSRRTPFDSFLFSTFGRLLFPKIKIVFSGHIGSLTSDDSVVP